MNVDWAEDEIVAVVDVYLEMLREEIDGAAFVKAEANRVVQEQTGRSRGSVEFKFANVSAALEDLGLPRVGGYKPLSNYQASLRSEIETRLTQGQLAWLSAPHIGSDFSRWHRASAEKEESAYWLALARLWSRANGGSDVAAAPDRRQDLFWPSGPSAPGASEATDWFHSRLQRTGRPALLFLLGGPGSGKSLAAACCVSDLQEVNGVPTELAQRAYEYVTPGGESLLLVNDATISSDVYDSSPLMNEIDDCISKGWLLLANVNRGILLEEKAGGSPSGLRGVGQIVVSWLVQADGTRGPIEESAGVTLTTMVDGPVVRTGCLFQHDAPLADVIAVYMDVCSLFEARPIVESDGAVAEFCPRVGPYSVARLIDRVSLDEESVPAAAVLADIAATLRSSMPLEDSATDPFRANVESLSFAEVRSGVLTTMRAAEISNSRRMTYRDLWGAVARLFVGDLTDIMTQPRPREWLQDNQPESPDPRRAFEQVSRLGDFRFHQALFGARSLSTSGERSASQAPALQLLTLVDPVRDARVGWSLPSQGWASTVLDAFAGLTEDSSPLASVRAALDEGDPFAAATTGFEDRLDEAFMKALRDPRLSDGDRRKYVGWYSSYLTRLYATAHGIPAFREEIDLWTVAWAVARTPHAVLPEELENSLRTLLLPPYDPDILRSPLVLPVFDARTVPITGGADSPRLALRVPSHWSLGCRTDGDALFVSLRDHDAEIVELELDFAMLREALACRQGHVGVTEYSHLASPRLERFRAALLRPGVGAQGSYVIVDGPKIFELIVEAPHG